jgi:hypothetical protein
VKKSTLWDRKKGVKPRRQGQSALQLLSPNQVSTANSVDSHCRWQKTYRRCAILQELILIEWINHLGMLGQPLESRTINPYVQDLCGRVPGVNWLRRFLKRNSKAVRYCRSMALDPKRAMCFNYTSIKSYFEQLKVVIETHKIPWENVYNMDEKGCQLGGGRKGRRQKYLFGRNSRARYRIRDANLELVTVVECVSADGHALKPYIIFKGKRIVKNWYTAEGIEGAAA